MAWPQTRGSTAATALILAIACSSDPVVEPTVNVLRTELNEQRAQWEALGLSDYDYIAQKSCFCREAELQPVRIAVRDGEIEAVRVLDTGEILAHEQYTFHTVDDLFEVIEHAIEHERDGMAFEYHSQYHYPVDIRFFDRDATDSGFRLEARDLTAVEKQ